MRILRFFDFPFLLRAQKHSGLEVSHTSLRFSIPSSRSKTFGSKVSHTSDWKDHVTMHVSRRRLTATDCTLLDAIISTGTGGVLPIRTVLAGTVELKKKNRGFSNVVASEMTVEHRRYTSKLSKDSQSSCRTLVEALPRRKRILKTTVSSNESRNVAPCSFSTGSIRG
jgi:hypothetical protein